MRSEGGQTQPSSFGSLINLFLLLADCCKGLLSPSVFHGTLVEVTAYTSLLCIKECSSTWNRRVPNGSDLIFSTGTHGWFWKGNLLGRNNPWCFLVYSFEEEKVNDWTYYLHAVQLISFWDALHLSQRKGKQSDRRIWSCSEGAFSYSIFLKSLYLTHVVFYVHFRHSFLAFSFLPPV